MTRVDHLTRDLGVTLTDHLAPAVWQALDNYAHEQAICDGFPSRGETARRGRSELTSVEAAASGAGHFTEKAAEIRRARDDIATAVKALAVLVLPSVESPALKAKRCRDGQFGRDAGAWSDNTGCPKVPDKAGLCQRHYSAWRRYRLAHGVDTSGDFEPGAA